MKKVIVTMTLALVLGLAVVGVVNNSHVTKQAGDLTTSVTTITDPGDGSRP